MENQEVECRRECDQGRVGELAFILSLEELFCILNLVSDEYLVLYFF